MRDDNGFINITRFSIYIILRRSEIMIIKIKTNPENLKIQFFFLRIFYVMFRD